MAAWFHPRYMVFTRCNDGAMRSGTLRAAAYRAPDTGVSSTSAGMYRAPLCSVIPTRPEEEPRDAAGSTRVHGSGPKGAEAGASNHAPTMLLDQIVGAAEGVGPLLQRDYWGVISRCRLTPQQLIDRVAHGFWRYPPPELVRFRRVQGLEGPLQVGDELEVAIRMAGRCRVRVVHRDACSLTLATLRGHPEAGRITFGAYRNRHRDVIFHIRSRARAATRTRYVEYLTGGDPMQTNTWTDFIDRLAAEVGEGVIGFIEADTRAVDENAEDRRIATPTFRASGD
jgi:hypothetical protein